VVIQVRNEAAVPVNGVQVLFQYMDIGGMQRQHSHRFSGIISPGKIASARTGLAPRAGSSCAVKVTAAEVAE
jgi:hypothetical protein